MSRFTRNVKSSTLEIADGLRFTVNTTLGVKMIAPPGLLQSWTAVLPTYPGEPKQTLQTDGTGILQWATGILQGGNTLSAPLLIGTQDSNSLVLLTNNVSALSLDTSANVTGAGALWTQNNVPMKFTYVTSYLFNSNYTSQVFTLTVPANQTIMKAQLWGAGGGGAASGSGGHTTVVLQVTPGDVYLLIVGAGGGSGQVSGGNIFGINSGAGGTGTFSVGGGGQWTAIIKQTGGTCVLVAAAGGGGSGGSYNGGGAGNSGDSSAGIGKGGQAGAGGAGGAGGGTGSRGQTASLVTTSIALFNGGGGGSQEGGGGGGGYGGGGGGDAANGAGGGGNYAPAVGGKIISSFSINGNNGGATAVPPPNITDANYIGSYGYSGFGGPSLGGPGLVGGPGSLGGIGPPGVPGSSSGFPGAGGLAVISYQIAARSVGYLSGTHLNLFNKTNTASVNIAVSEATQTYTLTVPVSAGTANQILQTDGTGVLSWVTPSLSPTITNVTAAGTTQASATLITTEYSVVINGSGGVQLPTAVVNLSIVIKNTSGAAITVYPSAAGTIDGVQSFALANLAVVRLVTSQSNISTTF